MWLLGLLLFLLPEVSHQIVTDCRSTEECSMNLNEEGTGCLVDCSHGSPWENQLGEMPTDLPLSTTDLILDNNQIQTVISAPFTSLKNIRYLTLAFNSVSNVSSVNITSLNVYNLGYNAIKAIHQQMFSGLKNLKSLYLDNNNISSIANGSFDDLKSLKVLNLTRNCLSFTDVESVPLALLNKLINLETLLLNDNKKPKYRGDLVANLVHLQELHLDGPRNRSANFPQEFLYLKKLDKLIVYGEMEYVTNSTFLNLSKCPVNILGLVGKRLVDFEQDALKPFKNLRILSILQSEKLSLCNVSHAWHGLSGSSNFKELYLVQVMDTYSDEALVPCNFFKTLNEDILYSIEVLDLGRNNLIHIDKQFTNLKSLQVFSLDFNRMPKIKKIICQPYGSISKEIPAPPCYSGCDGKSSPDVNTSSHQGILHLPASIRHLRLNVALNYDLDPMPYLRIDNCTSLEILEMDNNAIGNFEGPIVFAGGALNSNINVSLKGNFAEKLSPNFFKTDSRVKSLLLAGNKLGNRLWEDRAGTTFSKFNHLEELDLSENLIKTLPSDVFYNLKSLKVLNLSQNAITMINFDLTYMPNLQMLDLRGNSIVTLCKRDTDNLDAHGKLMINLESNPLVCSCEYLYFIQWLKDSDGQTKKPRYRQFKCHYGSEGYINLGRFFDKEFDNFFKDCYSYAYLLVSCICFAVMTVSLAAVIIAYKFRWDIKFLCTRLMYRKEWQQILDSDNKYEYDAFIAYHEDDLLWVRSQLLHHFEVVSSDSTSSSTDTAVNRPLKLCVHDRDFFSWKNARRKHHRKHSTQLQDSHHYE